MGGGKKTEDPQLSLSGCELSKQSNEGEKSFFETLRSEMLVGGVDVIGLERKAE